MNQNIVTSLSHSVISQMPVYRSLPIYQNSDQVSEAKAFKDVTTNLNQGDFCVCSK